MQVQKGHEVMILGLPPPSFFFVQKTETDFWIVVGRMTAVHQAIIPFNLSWRKKIHSVKVFNLFYAALKRSSANIAFSTSNFLA